MTIAIGLISEGDIDYIVVPTLLQNLLKRRKYGRISIKVERIRLRKRSGAAGGRGYGAATKAVLRLIDVIQDRPDDDYDFYCVVMDSRKTDSHIKEIRKKKTKARVYHIKVGLPKPELEAWVIADHNNVASHLGIQSTLSPSFKPERESAPKTILEGMINHPDADCDYGHWGKDAAEDIVPCLNSGVIYDKCPSFKRFADKFLQNCRSVISSRSPRFQI